MELGIPVVIAINMMDIVRKRGDEINIEKLSMALGCKIVEISALKLDGIDEAAEAAIAAAKNGKTTPRHIFSGTVEHALAHIEEAAVHDMPLEQQRWYSIKIFERDVRVLEFLNIDKEKLSHIETDIKAVENELDDDAEAIITNERYVYITNLVAKFHTKKNTGRLSVSDKIDRIVTNRILALPIFAIAMFLVYYISIGTVGDWTVGFMNDTLFGEWIIPSVSGWLESIDCAPWLVSLVADGIISGVGAVLGFVPQMFILFTLLSLLEDCGYMSRVAFIMDKIFRKFGLSGKSFIPMLVASGCGVPGIMASRTIEQDRDRKITIMTTGFIPCGAKMPIVGLVAAALFSDSWLGGAWVATLAYFLGIAAVIISGVILKKLKAFSGDPAPFVMELPSYHAPIASNVARTVWERGWGFIKRAGTVIFTASVIIWTLNNLSFEGGLHYIGDGDSTSILNVIGGAIARVFKPLGFGYWQAAVATVLGLVAKEEVVGVFGALGLGSAETAISIIFGGSGLAGISFLSFNLLCAPCFAAMGAIKREMNNWKWTAGTITYMCIFAYAVSLMIYQFGAWFVESGSVIGTAFAVATLVLMLYMLLRKNKNK
jgi:ferrous iron transport protein B